MRAPGRVSAAIEVLDDILNRHRPASVALADWGKEHRFAGAGDRAAIGNLVFDALRRRASCAWLMGEDTPRALALGALRLVWGMDAGAIAALCDDATHGPAKLSESELAGLARDLPVDAPSHVRADVPEWLLPSLTRAFGAEAVAEAAALALRAPIDLRVNTLRASRDKVLKALEAFQPQPTPFSPVGVRIAQPPGPARNPNVEAEAGHARGWFEVQDEASQLAALLTGAKRGEQIADLCAGAGGKTLALAAAMGNTGQIHAYDQDRMRLKPIFERLQRAGVRNVQVLKPGAEEALQGLRERMDVVLVDAPCTGSGTWRRRPDAKWRLKPRNLEERIAEQRAILTLAAPLVKSGGRLLYVTCSLLPEENGDQIAWFLGAHAGFRAVPYAEAWAAALAATPPRSADGREDGLLLTPRQHGTDGFFVALLRRS